MVDPCKTIVLIELSELVSDVCGKLTDSSSPFVVSRVIEADGVSLYESQIDELELVVDRTGSLYSLLLDGVVSNTSVDWASSDDGSFVLVVDSDVIVLKAGRTAGDDVSTDANAELSALVETWVGSMTWSSGEARLELLIISSDNVVTGAKYSVLFSLVELEANELDWSEIENEIEDNDKSLVVASGPTVAVCCSLSKPVVDPVFAGKSLMAVEEPVNECLLELESGEIITGLDKLAWLEVDWPTVGWDSDGFETVSVIVAVSSGTCVVVPWTLVSVLSLKVSVLVSLKS